MAKGKDYVLLKPLVIPAGTRLIKGPAVRQYAVPHYECLIGFGINYSATLTFDEEMIEAHPETFAELK